MSSGNTANWVNSVISVGALGDSFYEYLLKVWVYNGGADGVSTLGAANTRVPFDDAMEAIQQNLLTVSAEDNTYIAEMQSGTKDPKMGQRISNIYQSMCFAVASQHLGCRGSEPKHASNPDAVTKKGCVNPHLIYDCFCRPSSMLHGRPVRLGHAWSTGRER